MLVTTNIKEKMDIEKIKKAKTIILGKQIEYFQEITSTHLYAKEIAKKEEQNGKIILAEVQTGGIGTKGRKWYTGKREKYCYDNYFIPKGFY